MTKRVGVKQFWDVRILLLQITGGEQDGRGIECDEEVLAWPEAVVLALATVAFVVVLVTARMTGALDGESAFGEGSGHDGSSGKMGA